MTDYYLQRMIKDLFDKGWDNSPKMTTRKRYYSSMCYSAEDEFGRFIRAGSMSGDIYFYYDSNIFSSRLSDVTDENGVLFSFINTLDDREIFHLDNRFYEIQRKYHIKTRNKTVDLRSSDIDEMFWSIGDEEHKVASKVGLKKFLTFAGAKEMSL